MSPCRRAQGLGATVRCSICFRIAGRGLLPPAGSQPLREFPLVSWLLPRELHQHFFNVYAYCRWADDLGDEVPDSGQASQLLTWWQEQLSRCYHGSATHPVFVALRGRLTSSRFRKSRSRTCFRPSNKTSGSASMRPSTNCGILPPQRRSCRPARALSLSKSHRANAAWSDLICTGLQLANFWQDVARDFDKGRVYIPRETRRRFGYTDSDLANRVTNEPFLETMRFEVERAAALSHGGPASRQCSSPAIANGCRSFCPRRSLHLGPRFTRSVIVSGRRGPW